MRVRVAMGIALAALMLTALSPLSSVQAADIDVVEPAPVNNWYVSLHGGIKFGEDWDDHIDFGEFDLYENVVLEVEADVTAETENGLRFGGAVGYMINENFAIEGELGWMNQDFDSLDIDSIDLTFSKNGKVVESGTIECDHPKCSGIGLDGDVSIFTGMINLIAGFPVGEVIRPYLGIGAGFAHVSFNDVGLSKWESICCLDDSDNTFAVQGFVGVDVGVTENVAVGARYRVVKIGDLSVKDDGDFEHEIDPDLIQSLEAVLTLVF